MIDPKEVTAVFVVRKITKDLARIISNLPDFAAVRIFDNSAAAPMNGARYPRGYDAKVMGRYFAAMDAPTDVIYTQDDDCLVDPAPLFSAYVDGAVVCNMPSSMPWHQRDYSDTVKLVGWGALFDKRLVEPAFELYWRYFPWPKALADEDLVDEFLSRECDRIFTGLNRTIEVDAAMLQLPTSTDSTRMCAENRHVEDLAKARRRVAHILEQERLLNGSRG